MPIGRLIEFLTSSIDESEQTGESHEEGIRLATAAVLLDVAHAGSVMGDREKREIVEHLTRAFELEGEAAKELLDAADELRSDTIDHFALTNRIRQATSRDERMEIVRAMWRIVYADLKFHQYEGYLVRKLSDLLGIEHSRMIEAKMEVRRDLGIED